MQRFKLLVLVALAVFALGATVAASAYAGVEALNAEKKATTATFKGNSEKTGALTILGSSLEVTCKKTTSEGTLEVGGKLGSGHTAFEGCGTNAGGTCTGLGDAAGTVLALGTGHLATNTALTVGYILGLTEHLHYSCTVLGITKLLLVLGEYICEVTPINALAGKLTIKCNKGAEKGDPAVTSYVNDAGKAATLTNALQAVEGDTTTETMAALAGEGEVTVTPSVTLDV